MAEDSSIPERGSQEGGDRRRNCFVVMPFGRTPEEHRWFRGWYDLVIKEAILTSNHYPVLSANLDAPSAINDEIRSHLAYDPMVVVDLGGMISTDPPNPNVMYELGIRHALNLPLVIMAWQGQTLPFDISNQRVLVERRELVDVPLNRERLVRFIREAEQGNFYRPMEAVGRVANLALAEESLDRGSVLRNLIREVRDLRQTQSHQVRRAFVRPAKPITIKNIFGDNAGRKLFFKTFTEAGGSNDQWNYLLSTPLTAEFEAKAAGLDAQAKESFVLAMASSLASGVADRPAISRLVASYFEDISRTPDLFTGPPKENEA